MTFGAPQIIMIVLIVIVLMLSARFHNTPKTGRHNMWIDLLGITLQQLLLWWGGFWG